MPVALEHLYEEEADAAIADAHGVGRPAIAVSPVQEVGLQFGLRDRRRGLPVNSTNMRSARVYACWVRSPLPLSCSALMDCWYQS